MGMGFFLPRVILQLLLQHFAQVAHAVDGSVDLFISQEHVVEA